MRGGRWIGVRSGEGVRVEVGEGKGEGGEESRGGNIEKGEYHSSLSRELDGNRLVSGDGRFNVIPFREYLSIVK